MVIVFYGICLDLFKGTIFLGDLIFPLHVGAEVSAGLSLLHIVQNVRELVWVVVECFQNLRVELHIIITVVKEVLVKVALRQIRVFDNLVGTLARIRAAHPFHHGVAGVVVGIYQRPALQFSQAVGGVLVFKDGIRGDLSRKLPLG